MNKLIVVVFVWVIGPNLIFAQKDWAFVKNKNEIELSEREFLNKGIKQFRLKTTFKQTSLSAIFTAFREHSTFHEWQGDIKELHTVKRISDMENYDYYNFSFPWPFRNRDAIYHQNIIYNKKDKILSLNFSLEPDFIPAKEGIQRMKVAKGEWKFVKLANGDIEANYQNYSDPVGIPADVVNILFSDALMRTMTNLREHVKKEKYKLKAYSFIQE